MGKYESLIGIAGVLGLVSFSALLGAIYKTHNTTSLPWTWLFMNLAAQILSFIYGLVNGSWGIVVPGILFMSGLVYIFYVKSVKKELKSIKKL